MKTINILIAVLIAAGILGLALVEGVVKPKRERREQQYLLEQKDPLTHDFSRALRFKSEYMGDASNLANLYGALPLAELERSLQLHPDQLKAEIFYQDPARIIDPGEDLFRRALVYNAAANFALIGNLETLVLHFPWATYTAGRDAVEGWYGLEASTLQDDVRWKSEVQSKLADAAFVERFLEEVFETN